MLNALKDLKSQYEEQDSSDEVLDSFLEASELALDDD